MEFQAAITFGKADEGVPEPAVTTNVERVLQPAGEERFHQGYHAGVGRQSAEIAEANRLRHAQVSLARLDHALRHLLLVLLAAELAGATGPIDLGDAVGGRVEELLVAEDVADLRPPRVRAAQTLRVGERLPEFGRDRFVGLVAAAMLLYVSYWLHSKASMGVWQNYLHTKTTTALASGRSR